MNKNKEPRFMFAHKVSNNEGKTNNKMSKLWKD